MPSENGRLRSTVDEIARSLRSQMTPVNSRFLFFSIFPIGEEDLREYVHDPIAALPKEISDLLPPSGIVLAPYLERAAGRGYPSVVYEKPPESKLIFATRVDGDNFATFFFTVKDEQVSDYHYFLYEALSAVVAQRTSEPVSSEWMALIRSEIEAQLHGEVDERSWRLKQAVLRRPVPTRTTGKPFREYATRAFEDTLTLYLHGVCCDIDVDPGPRQLPSRHIRKRLELLRRLFPPPQGYAVFPEDISREPVAPKRLT
jgi:hypothetical protein